jgi:hypothetical protein
MSFRLAGLALGAALALAVPAAPAHAAYCNPSFQAVCDAVILSCQALEPAGVACTIG